MNRNTGVLMLNVSFEPLTVIPLDEAICKIVTDEATILHEDETKGPIRSQYLTLPFPSVIRLNHYVRPERKSGTRLNTRTVVARDNGECCYCEDRPGDTIDHVHPTSRGGKNVWTNVVAACSRCNSIKSDKTLEELGWTMRFEPTIPAQHHWLTVGHGQRSTWNQYAQYAH